MNALTRSGTASLAMSILLCASVSPAVHREGDTTLSDPGSPTERSLIGGPLGQYDFSAATRGFDCEEARVDFRLPGSHSLASKRGFDSLSEFDALYTAATFQYASREYRVKPRLQLNVGMRYSSDVAKVDLQLEPNLSISGLYVPPQMYGVLPTGIDWSFQDPGSGNLDVGSGGDPIKGTFDASASARFELPRDYGLDRGGLGGRDVFDFSVGVQRSENRSLNIEARVDDLPRPLARFGNHELSIGDSHFTTLDFQNRKLGLVYNALDPQVFVFENDWCRFVLTPTDPNFKRTGRHGGGSWGQPMDDQWAIKRVGYTADESSAWNQVPDTAAPVVVAVIDTGLDWHHLDISYENIWRNEGEIPDNGIDDDANGFVDDIIGWDFFGRHNKPWDFDGHGTLVGGIIAASQDNDAGIAGVNPHAKLMVLKAVNNFGTTRASYLAEAIVYAADNGARIINISVGGPHTSRIEQAAIDYAHEKGVLVVVASGNEGIELEDYGPAGADNVLTVGATHTDDRAAEFSNFGDRVDLVAPGVDVLSLRARYTDANYRGTGEYEIGTNYVGEDKRYLHVSGTSFSAPIVTGTASLLLARSPELTVGDVERILYQTAEDIEFPGKDKYAGFGMLDARTALSVDPEFFVTAAIDRAQFVQVEGGGSRLRISGTADAEIFKRGWLQIGEGENPAGWKSVGRKLKFPVRDGTLGSISLREFRGSEFWQLVVNVEHKNGTVKRAVYPVRLN